MPEEIKRKVNKSLDFLDVDFRHPSLRSHPVRSHPGIFEAYVDDKYRMTFERKGDVLIMRNVDNPSTSSGQATMNALRIRKEKKEGDPLQFRPVHHKDKPKGFLK